MSKNQIYRIGKVLVFSVLILMLFVLCMAATTRSDLKKERPDGAYTLVQEVSNAQIEKEDTLTGTAEEYRLVLGEIGHADTLVFYVIHHNVEVYIADQCVYEVKTKEGNLHTLGGVYAMIPLSSSDAGKEVRVVLSGLYKGYRYEPDFYVGSELAIYQAVFWSAVPEMVLSFCTIVIGSFLICLALYHSIRHYPVLRMYATGLLAVSAGVWRFTYGRFVYLLFPDHSALIYTLSVIAMMLVALAMLGCVRIPETMKSGKKLLIYVLCAYCGIYLVQLLFQLTGVLDLRQQLTMMHIMIVFSALLVLAGGIFSWISERKHTTEEKRIGKFVEQNFSWILGIGAIVDLLLYYYAENSLGMLFILGAIMCYSMLEGFRLLMNFSRQRNELEEMKTKLTLSRTATMMSQIRSHFVFNLLNAISGMCKYDPEKADDTIVRFARYLRNNIDIMEKDQNIPFATDLRQLEDYVVLEQVRFGDKVEFYTDIETAAEIHKELAKCTYKPLPSHRVVIETIPAFGITVDGTAFYISGAKPREMLALLVDAAGHGVTMGECIACLWPDRAADAGTQSLYRMTWKRLSDALENAGVSHIIATSENKRYIKTEAVDCDLYRILAGDREAARKYNGEYLKEYEWAEERNAQLYRLLIEKYS